MHLIVAPQLSGGWQHNYSTKTWQADHANEQSFYLLKSMACAFKSTITSWHCVGRLCE